MPSERQAVRRRGPEKEAQPVTLNLEPRPGAGTPPPPRAHSRQFELGTYSSWGGIFDSISMSRNSLDSKTSRHSMHSTYSASSSRATTWTRGCRHGWSMALLCRKFGVRLIGWPRFMTFARCASIDEIFRYCRPEPSEVKLFRLSIVLILTTYPARGAGKNPFPRCHSNPERSSLLPSRAEKSGVPRLVIPSREAEISNFVIPSGAKRSRGTCCSRPIHPMSACLLASAPLHIKYATLFIGIT